MDVDPRVIFAAERTLLSWIRTALSLIGLGFVVARFGMLLQEMPQSNPATSSGHGSLWLGMSLMIAGVAVSATSVAQHVAVIRRLRSGATAFEAKLSPAIWLAVALAMMAVAAGIYLFTLR